MGVDRSIEIKLVTNFDYFTEILQLLIENGYSFNDDGTVASLSDTDIDEFDFILYNSFADVKDVLNRREDNQLDNHVSIWDRSIDDSLLVSSKRLNSDYRGYRNQYNLTFNIGHGIRIEGADRYTDYSKYLNKLLPIFTSNSMYVCEINCCDFDC